MVFSLSWQRPQGDQFQTVIAAARQQAVKGSSIRQVADEQGITGRCGLYPTIRKPARKHRAQPPFEFDQIVHGLILGSQVLPVARREVGKGGGNQPISPNSRAFFNA